MVVAAFLCPVSLLPSCVLFSILKKATYHARSVRRGKPLVITASFQKEEAFAEKKQNLLILTINHRIMLTHAIEMNSQNIFIIAGYCSARKKVVLRLSESQREQEVRV